MAYCMYLRKSRSDRDAEMLSGEDTLSRHYAILTDLAARNRHAIGAVFREVVSGDSITERPQCQQMLNDLIAGKWEGVYVTAIDRLARGDTADQGTIQRVLMVSGALIVTPTSVYNAKGSATDEQAVDFSLFLARQEYKSINRRQRAGIERSLDEGKHVAHLAAYGYRRYKLPDQRGHSLTPHKAESAVVLQIGMWYLYGMDGQPMGLTAIASRLTDLGVPPGDNAKVWSASRIHRILTNPVYAGWIRYGHEKQEKIVTLTGVEKRRVIDNNCKLRKGLHEPIYTQEMFDAIQAKLHGYQKHLPVRKGAPLANPLAGLIYCSECGHVMSHLPASGRQPALIKCRTRGCPTVQNYREPVEQAVLATLRQWLDDSGAISGPASHQPDPAPVVSALDALHAERKKLASQIDRLQDLLEQGVYDVPTYSSRFSRLQQRLDAIDQSIAAEEAAQAARPVYATPAQLRPALTHLFEHYDGATPQEQNDMLKACISRVVYSKSKKGLHLRGEALVDPNQFELEIYPLLVK